MGVGEGDDDLLTSYSTLSPTTFTDMASFKKSIMSCYNGFVVGSNAHHQYMAFTHVNPCFIYIYIYIYKIILLKI